MSPALGIREAAGCETLARILVSPAFAPPRAEHCARLFAEASMDGVASHGLAPLARRGDRAKEPRRSGTAQTVVGSGCAEEIP